jgi:transposase
MAFIRKIKKKSGTYLAEVESYRANGKVKQRVIKYLGRDVNGIPAKKTNAENIKLKSVKRSLDINVIYHLLEELGLTKLIENKCILALVFSQILQKRSINRLEDWFELTEIPELLKIDNYSTKQLYLALRATEQLDFDKIETKLMNKFNKKYTSKQIAIIDITDTYFEGKSQEIKSRKGKESKVRKLIQYGLAVSETNGFPLFHKTYQGNLGDSNILKDMALELNKKNLQTIIVDRGMSSKENIDLILNQNLKSIMGIRRNKKLERKFIKNTSNIHSVKNRIELISTTIYAQEFEYYDGKLIVIYNPHIALISKEKALKKGQDEDKSYGYSLIYHNTNLSVSRVVKQYFEKDIVERDFRQIKGVLNLRPIRVWLKEHIEGHFRICYLAYAVLSFMEFKLKKHKMHFLEALDSLRNGYKVTLEDEINNNKWDLTVPLEPKQKQILKLLECSVQKGRKI